MPFSSTGLAFDHRPAGYPGSPQIVLIHAGVADRRMWDPQWEALTDFDLTRVDLRGFGQSTRPPVGGAFSHADDVVSVMNEIGLDRPHVVGASFGAGVAVEVALTEPQRVASLVLAPPGGALLSELTDDLRAFFAAERQALEGGDLSAATDANIDAWVIGSGRSRDEVDPQLVEKVRHMQLDAFAAASALGDVEADECDPPALQRLQDVAVPALIISGTHDMDTTAAAARDLCARLPTSECEVWPETAHLPSLERPREFTRRLIEWLSSLDG